MAIIYFCKAKHEIIFAYNVIINNRYDPIYNIDNEIINKNEVL